MKYSGNLIKMKTVLSNPVDYFLTLGENEIYMNDLIGKKITMEFNGVINCVKCGKKTKKSFSQGFCYNCMQTAPEADLSVVRPELSKAQFGVAKDIEWAKEHDLIDHYVYLSITNDIKVGVTRFHQLPTRWIDQGAIKAIKLAKTPNRHIAGVIETFLKRYVADITKWQSMLKDDINQTVDLLAEKNRIAELLPAEFKKYIEIDNKICEINYPGNFILQNISSFSFDKQAFIEGEISRIKGQYLIFVNGTVLNMRKHSGYFINFTTNN